MATERATSAVDAVPMATGAPAPVARAGFAFPPTQLVHIRRGCEEPSTVNKTYSVPMGAGVSATVVTLYATTLVTALPAVLKDALKGFATVLPYAPRPARPYCGKGASGWGS